MTMARRLAAECLGTAFLLMAVVGSGIMAERLADGNMAIALLANTMATCATLLAIIVCLAPVSGAHFNPAVTVSLSLRGRLPWREAPPYIAAQVLGGVAGVLLAHVMFEAPVFSISGHARTGAGQAVSEFVATFGLLAIIWGVADRGNAWAPMCIAAYIAGAYWFTASTSFANPAVTFARAWTDTFAGIQPGHVPAFVVAQLLGALAATGVFAWLMPREARG